MKLKIALLAVALLLASVQAFSWCALRPVSEPRSQSSVTSIDLLHPDRLQYDVTVYCVGRRPIVACMQRRTGDAPRVNERDLEAQLADEVDARVTNLASWQGNVALFAVDSQRKLQPIPISFADFDKSFRSVRETDRKNPFELIEAIWNKHVAPHMPSASSTMEDPHP